MLDLAMFIVFIVALALLVYSDRKNIQRQGIIIIRRTNKGKAFIDRVARRAPRFWNAVSKIGITVGIGVMIIGTATMIKLAVDLILLGARAGGIALLLPGPVATAVAVPGVFIVPWWIWIIGVAVVIIPHEFFHGIMSRIDKVRIKSVGWILFLILPGAFVEPDEKQLEKSSRKTKLSVYAAGSFINIAIGLFLLLVLSLFLFSAGPQTEPVGIAYLKMEGLPADLAELSGPIVALNGIEIRNHEDMKSTLSQFSSGEEITVRTLDSQLMPVFSGEVEYIFPKAIYVVEGSVTKDTKVTLTEHPDIEGAGYLGIYYAADAHRALDGLNVQMIQVIVWVYVFCIGIGLVNLLPLKPLDGGLIFEQIADKYAKKKRKIIVRGMSLFILFLILFNLIFPILRNALGF